MENPFSAPPSLSSLSKEISASTPPLPSQDEPSSAELETRLPDPKPEFLEEESSPRPASESFFGSIAPAASFPFETDSKSEPQGTEVEEEVTDEDLEFDKGGFVSAANQPAPQVKPVPKPKARPQGSPSNAHHQPASYASAEGWSDADFDDDDDSELPALTMEEKSCRVCKYFEFEENTRVEARFGECRRNAPKGVGKAMWPSVLWDSWCGEWTVGVGQDEMMQMVRSAAKDAH